MQSSSRSTNSRQGMTSEEMINHSSEWTLAFDNALLNRLKEFSEIVDTASQEVNTECETLAKDINRLQSRVLNVTNEFLMLSNTQFVENRVQEFEETMESNSVPPSINNGKIKTKSEKEVELIAKMKEAIQIGVSTNVQHDKMQLSENQQQNSFPQLKLPHLIGTSKFFSSKYCGLTDDSKSTMPIPDKSTSNNPRVQLSRILSNSSESLPSIPPCLDSVPHDSISTDSRQPHMQDSYDNDSEHSVSSVKNPSTSADSTKENVTVNDWDSTKSSRAKTTSSIVEDLNNAFRSRLPPPPDDESESDDDFKPSSNKKLFGDDDDDLFGENSLFASRQQEDIFGKPVVSDSIFSSQKTSNVKSRFNENKDENEKFRKKSESHIVPSTAKQPSESNVNAVSATKPKIPAGAVPILGGPNSPQPPLLSKISSSAGRQEGNVKRGYEPSREAIKSAANSSQHAEKENKFTSQSSLTSECQQDSKHASSQGSSSDIHVPHSSVNIQPKPKINSLFDENSDDDLFAPSNFFHGKKSNSSSLFDDNLKRNSSKSFTKTAQLKPKGRLKPSIFDDSDSGDDLFSSASSSSSKSKEKSSISNVNQFFKPSLSIFTGRATESLFDDQEDDIFSSGQKVKVNVGSEGSNNSDKSKPSVSSATVETYLPSSKDQPVVVKEKQILNDSKFTPFLTTTTMDSEADTYKQDEPESLSAKNGVTDSETKNGLDSSNSQRTSNEPGINTSAFADSVISKPDTKVSDLNKDNSVADGVVKDKDVLQSNPNAISSPVTRPQSLQIQPDKLPSCETTSVQQDKDLFSETSDKTMLHSVDGNSNFKSKVSKLSSKITSPTEVSEKTSSSQSTDAGKEIGKLKSSVKSIASNLKINPLALRPGSRPPKSSESTSQPSTPTSDPTIPDPVIAHEESNGLLTSVAKNRPKILQQRRPPSRKLRKSNYSADSIDGTEQLSNNTKADAEIKTLSQASDSIFSVGDESEPTSPTVPADILSPSTEEEDIFSIGIESNQRPSFGVEIASPDEDSILKPGETETPSEVNQSVVTVESIANNLPNTKSIKSTLEPSQHYDSSVETTRSLSQNNRNPTRITLPSSKITQCSDSDSDDIFSNLSRKISHDSSSLKSKVKGDEDLFSEKPLAKQTDRQIKSAPPVAQTNIQTESPQVEKPKDAQALMVGTENVNGQNRAAKTTKSLFSDSDDEDIFMPKSKIPSNSKPKVQEKVEKQVSSSVAPSLTSNKQKGLFDSDSDDDNLFGAKVKKPSFASSATTQNVITSSKPASAIKTSRAAKLFSDSSDDDIFSSSKPATKAPARKISAEKQTKQSSDDIRHHIFDDPLNNI